MSHKFTKQRWRISEKLRFFAESWNLEGDELGRYLRKHGLHSHDLQIWKEQMAMGISGETPVYLEERKYYKSKIKNQKTRIEKLEKELKEARALLELQKKVKKLGLGVGARKRGSKPEKK